MNEPQIIEWFSFEPPCAGFTPGLVAHDAGYIMGAVEPRYPVPVTIDVAVIVFANKHNYGVVPLCCMGDVYDA